MVIARVISSVIIASRKAFRRLVMHLVRPAFRDVGKNVVFDPFDHFSFDRIAIGNDVAISTGAHFSATNTSLTIGNKVMFGPNVTILCGDHNVSRLGEFMFDVTEKLPENDLPVVIDDDVWVGSGAIILKGVHVGRGAIIAAGAVVTRDVQPYSIVAGVPARFMRFRWSDANIRLHDSKLYPSDRRLMFE